MMEIKEIKSSVNGEVVLRLQNCHTRRLKTAYIEDRHPELEITLFKNGSGIYATENGVYDFKDGDIFVFTGNESHMIIETNGWIDVMNIQFEPRFIWDNGSELFDTKFLKIFFDRNKNFCNRLDRDNKAIEKIRELMYETENEFREENVGWEHMVKVLLLTILVTIIRHYDYVNLNDDMSLSASNYSVIAASIDFINKNLTEKITLSQIAGVANMSSTHYCVVFKKLNGISPWDYISAKRVDMATRLLRETNFTILEIALECGFNNTVNFNRAFKKYIGCTPSQFRQNRMTRLCGFE